MKTTSRRILMALGILSLALHMSCASFNGRMLREDKDWDKDQTLQRIEGTYRVYPYKEYKKNGAVVAADNTSFYSSAYYQINQNTSQRDTIINASLRISKTERRKLHFELLNGSELLDSCTVGVRYRSDGMAYLDNREFSINGVPFLFGGWHHSKTRIGLTKSNDLMIQRAVDSGGAILIILAAGHSYNSAYGYQRISDH